MIRNNFHTLLLVLSGLFLSNVVLANNDILDRFAGVYAVKNGPHQVQFVLSPRGQELHGNIVYQGRDYPLTVTVDGLILKAVFDSDGNLINFRMPLSTKRQFQVTFAEDDFGAWTFLRLPLPAYAGEFSTDFGRVTLSPSSRGVLTGEYFDFETDEVTPVRGIVHGLEVELEGIDSAKLLYSLEERVYFAQIGGHFSQSFYRTPNELEQERKAMQKHDDMDWRIAFERQTASALDQYLEDWPDGLHADEVSTIKDDLLWKSTVASDHIEDYLDYINQFPKAKHMRMADDAVWNIAQKANTDVTYSAYIKAFPTGRHLDKVLVKKDDLAWQKADDNDHIKGYGAYAKQNPNGLYIQPADDAAWSLARRKNSDAAYNAYLKALPAGSHAIEVPEAKAKAAVARRDDKAFDVVRQNNSLASYKDYMVANPVGRHVKAAQAGIDKALTVIEAKKDDAAWQSILADKSEAALKRYIVAWPSGRHTSEASAAIVSIQTQVINRQDDIAFVKAQRGNSTASYKAYLKKFGGGRHKNDAQTAINNLKQAFEARVAFIQNIQSKLQTLGYAAQSSRGTYGNKTKKSIRAFERDRKLSIKGEASELLAQQLDESIEFNNALKRAKTGSVDDMVAAGNRLFTGKGVMANQVKAVAWFKKAAQDGNPEAMAKLGYSYIAGIGGEKNEKLGVKWLRKAVRLGNSEGMFQMALLYLQGIEVRKNNKKGIGWLVKSVDNGRVESLNFLGDLYFKGEFGIEQDHKKASEWYAKAGVKSDAE